ncbi:MAG: UxaA family hydrolase [Syntrophales bacterium LBB04]|jgi:altronate dehydratase small subunit|nr:UxaA family hydrolase [Syntrophales bacterium LBB04]
MSEFKAIVMKATDNVATVVEALEPGTEAALEMEGRRVTVRVAERIPFGHKFATRDIKKGDVVIKYGEPIGVATQDIGAGMYVHVHNVESSRGRGDR